MSKRVHVSILVMAALSDDYRQRCGIIIGMDVVLLYACVLGCKVDGP